MLVRQQYQHFGLAFLSRSSPLLALLLVSHEVMIPRFIFSDRKKKLFQGVYYIVVVKLFWSSLCFCLGTCYTLTVFIPCVQPLIQLHGPFFQNLKTLLLNSWTFFIFSTGRIYTCCTCNFFKVNYTHHTSTYVVISLQSNKL